MKIRLVLVIVALWANGALAFNQEDVEKLRNTGSCQKCDLSKFQFPDKAKLNSADLTGANLFGAKLTNANLFGAKLTGANLTNANLTGANLAVARLINADLTGANLTNANLTGANLTNAKGLKRF